MYDFPIMCLSSCLVFLLLGYRRTFRFFILGEGGELERDKNVTSTYLAVFTF